MDWGEMSTLYFRSHRSSLILTCIPRCMRGSLALVPPSIANTILISTPNLGEHPPFPPYALRGSRLYNKLSQKSNMTEVSQESSGGDNDIKVSNKLTTLKAWL